MINPALFASDSAEWETPQDLFDQLNEEFNFKLDVCATPENTKCAMFYDKEIDGLILSWFKQGANWCNPPYGREVGNWVAKAAGEAQKGATVVMLLPARTDTKYFHRHIWDKENHRPRPGIEVRFLQGRLKFGNSKNSAPFPSMVVVFKQVIP